MNKRERVQRKPSLGIALCRREPETKIPQILLVRSRITYSYSGFVFGKYKPWDNERIMTLFTGVTPEEKLLIWSCDFARIWYHIWQKIPEAGDSFYQFYINSKTKFEHITQRDAGRRLKFMLTATACGELGWDIPGGKPELRQDGTAETELETAQREMIEEAGVAAAEYHVLHAVTPICSSFEDDKTVWVRKYYVAWTDREVTLSIDYNNVNQLCEVSAVRWCSLRDVAQLTAQNKCLRDQVSLALQLFKKHVKVY